MPSHLLSCFWVLQDVFSPLTTTVHLSIKFTYKIQNILKTENRINPSQLVMSKLVRNPSYITCYFDGQIHNHQLLEAGFARLMSTRSLVGAISTLFSLSSRCWIETTALRWWHSLLLSVYASSNITVVVEVDVQATLLIKFLQYTQNQNHF